MHAVLCTACMREQLQSVLPFRLLVPRLKVRRQRRLVRPGSNLAIISMVAGKFNGAYVMFFYFDGNTYSWIEFVANAFGILEYSRIC